MVAVQFVARRARHSIRVPPQQLTRRRVTAVHAESSPRGVPCLGDAESLQKHQRRLAAAVGHRPCQQLARVGEIPGAERLQAAMQQFLRFPLLLGKRTASALDVRTGPPVAALEKRHPGPDIDGLFVSAFEVVVETGQQEPFDQRIAIRVGGPITGRRGAQRLGHEAADVTEARLL